MRSTTLFALPTLIALAGTAAAQGAADKFDFDEIPAFRGAVNSQFAGWDVFTIAFGGPNLPDDPASNATAEITQTVPGAIITSTQNIYSPGATPMFELTGTTTADTRQIVLQLRTLGNPLDVASVELEFDAGAGTQTVAPDVFLDLNGGGFALETYYMWDLTDVAGDVLSYTIAFDGSAPNMSLDAVLLDLRVDGPIGSTYCMANPNSTGATGQIEARGSDVFEVNDLTLSASSLPMNSAGFFLASTTQGFAANPGGSDGNLCLAGSVGRIDQQVFNTGSTGTGEIVLDLTNIPQPTGFVSAAAGETWNFQCWHRDANPAATSNFTNAVSVTLL